jgi:DNA ligase-1
MSTLRPMLAAPIESEDDLKRLRYPVFVSPKFDGVRARTDPKVGVVSRKHLRLPNQQLQRWFAEARLSYLDGELLIGEPTAANVFNKTQSALMSQGCPLFASEDMLLDYNRPIFTYHVFDHWFYLEEPYTVRLGRVSEMIENLPDTLKAVIKITPQTLCNNADEILALETTYLEEGYEGIIVRSTDGIYKNGRSTFKQGLLLKFKRLEDDEAVVVGFTPLERNQNERGTDALGYTKRSTAKAGRVVDDLLGTLIVEHPTFGQFGVGTGFDVDTRVRIWQDQDYYLGKTITFKYQAQGMKDKPRFPIFKGFRHD